LVAAVEVEEEAFGIAGGTERFSTTPLDTAGGSSSNSGTSFKPRKKKSI
jgi:hypothetical protein